MIKILIFNIKFILKGFFNSLIFKYIFVNDFCLNEYLEVKFGDFKLGYDK